MPINPQVLTDLNVLSPNVGNMLMARQQMQNDQSLNALRDVQGQSLANQNVLTALQIGQERDPNSLQNQQLQQQVNVIAQQARAAELQNAIPRLQVGAGALSRVRSTYDEKGREAAMQRARLLLPELEENGLLPEGFDMSDLDEMDDDEFLSSLASAESAWSGALEDMQTELAGSTLISGPDAEALGFAPGSVVERTSDGKFEMVQGPQQDAADVNVTLNQGEVSEVLLSRLDEQETKANTAVSSLRNVQRAQQLVEQGIIAGPAAEFRLNLTKALGFVGLTDDEAAARTEEFVASLAGPVAQIIQQFGAGTGLSDADREFARQAAGGNIEMNPDSIRRILKISDQAFRFDIDRYNDSLQNRTKNFPQVRDLFDPIEAPEAQQIVFGDAGADDNEGDIAINQQGVRLRVINGRWVRDN